MRFGFYTGGTNNSDYIIDSFRLDTDYTAYSSVEIVELGPNQAYVEISDENYLTAYNKFCIVDEDCALKFTYSYQAIGDSINIYSDIGGFPSGSSLGSSTLAYYPNTSLRVEIPIATSSTIKSEDFCVITTNDNYTICGINVLWTIGDDDDCDYVHMCDDISSSTGIYDEFRYGIECGFRKSGCWAFNPDSYNYILLSEQIIELENSFPMTIFNQIRDTVSEMNATTSDDLVIPWKAGNIDLGTFIGTSTFLALGQDIFDKYDYLASTFIWIIVITYFIIRIKSLSYRNAD